MVVRKSNPPTLYLSTPSPEDSPRCSVILSDCDADDEGTMSTEESMPTRPWSASNCDGLEQPVGPYCPRRPTLQDILANTAPPPWSLSAFTAYLSQNHCLETLEFTMDAERYRQRYDKMAAQMAGIPMSRDYEECDYVGMLWQRLMDAYIIPNGPREVNLPSCITHRLLSLPNDSAPPPPEELDEAVKIVYELMDESALIPFLNKVSPSRGLPPYKDGWNDSDENILGRSSQDESSRHGRSGRRVSPPSSSLDMVTSPNSDLGSYHSYSSNMAQNSSRNRFPARMSHSSTGSGDVLMTDDSASPSSPGKEPMTPPNTPPSSDFGGSPRNRNDNTWKKMMGRLGTKKKSSSKMRRAADEGEM